jgi:hypothetical protein
MKILITESQLTVLIKKSITENINKPQFVEGCNNFPKNSENREWCEKVKPNIINKISDIEKKIDYVKSFLQLEGFEDLVHNIEIYKKDDPFFSYRLSQLEEVKKLLSGCDDFNKKIKEHLEKIERTAIFVNRNVNNYEYSILNKLESNYSAIAFLLTTFREKNNLIELKLDFNSIYNMYFKSEGGNESPFTNFLINYFSLEDNDNIKRKNDKEIMKKVLATMEETTKMGAESEREAYEYLVSLFGNERVKDYTGDYSFVDMFGIDFMVYTKNLGWIPVQVKSSEKKVKGSSKLCNNLGMGKKDGKWEIKKFIGKTEVKKFIGKTEVKKFY